MTIYNRYILSLLCLLLVTTVVLIAVGYSAIETYYTIYITEAFIITELFVYFSKEARRWLTWVGAVLFAGFLLVLSVEVIRILV